MLNSYCIFLKTFLKLVSSSILFFHKKHTTNTYINSNTIFIAIDYLILLNKKINNIKQNNQ